jgi:hypothetical protein
MSVTRGTKKAVGWEAEFVPINPVHSRARIPGLLVMQFDGNENGDRLTDDFLSRVAEDPLRQPYSNS